MAGIVNFEVDFASISRSVNRFSAIANVAPSEAWTRALRRLVRYMQAITPPGDGKGEAADGAKGLGTADRERGNKAIERDLRNLFIGVQRRGGVAGMDPDPIHHRLFNAYKIPGKKLRRDRPEPYPVDMVKVARLERFLKARVGKTAAQWTPGFLLLGISPAAFIAKQTDGAAKGSASRRDAFLSFQFQISANSMPDAFAGEIERRSRYALKYTEASIGREMDAILTKAAGQAAA